MPNQISEGSTIFADLSAFFSTPERPLTIEEVNETSAHELRDLLIDIRAQKAG